MHASSGSDPLIVLVCSQDEEAADAWPLSMVVIDAGSSGSRAHIFRYHQDSTSPLPAVQLPQSVVRTTPGLSSFADDPQAAAASIRSLIHQAQREVTFCPCMHSVRYTFVHVRTSSGVTRMLHRLCQLLPESVVSTRSSLSVFAMALKQMSLPFGALSIKHSVS
jgi:hypothetical protein